MRLQLRRVGLKSGFKAQKIGIWLIEILINRGFDSWVD